MRIIFSTVSFFFFFFHPLGMKQIPRDLEIEINKFVLSVPFFIPRKEDFTFFENGFQKRNLYIIRFVVANSYK